VREDLLLRIMSFVEDSGTNLASPSADTLLERGRGIWEGKDQGCSEERVFQKPGDGKNAGKKQFWILRTIVSSTRAETGAYWKYTAAGTMIRLSQEI